MAELSRLICFAWAQPALMCRMHLPALVINYINQTKAVGIAIGLHHVDLQFSSLFLAHVMFNRLSTAFWYIFDGCKTSSLQRSWFLRVSLQDIWAHATDGSRKGVVNLVWRGKRRMNAPGWDKFLSMLLSFTHTVFLTVSQFDQMLYINI